MDADYFESLKRYIGFTARDAVNLGKMADLLVPCFANVVERFYGVIFQDPAAAGLFAEGHDQLDRLKEMFMNWMTGLFGGRYDMEYFQQRCEIGRAHVEVRLPQYLMVTGMSAVRTELTKSLGELELGEEEAYRVSLNKVLDLDLAIMLETYRQDEENLIRRVERDRMEAKLTEAAHLAHLGRLAASLAHEIKNPLAGISGAIQVLGQGMGPEDERREIIEEILRQIDRLDSAVKDLLIYARPVPPAPKRRALGEILLRVLKLLEASPALRRVEVVCHGLEDSPEAYVDDGQVEQVFCNLILNACHASERGSRLDVFFEADGEFCEIRFQDYGKGMGKEVLGHAFEPFYTTKARGTGLGLPICKRIIKAHGGMIDLTSQSGRGTTATVRLPMESAAVHARQDVS